MVLFIDHGGIEHVSPTFLNNIPCYLPIERAEYVREISRKCIVGFSDKHS